MGSNHARQEVIENYITAYNNFDSDGMLRDLHDDIFFENIYNGEVTLQTSGIVEFRAQAELAKKLFTERKQQILDTEFNDNTAEVRIDFTGILSDNPANGSQAGITIHMTGNSIFLFEGGKIIRITDQS